MNTFSLKSNMLLGAASAATQIEGGSLNHSWNDWADKGHIKDGTSPRRANNHWHLWREDTRLMKDMGLQICRLGIEWARIQPREGVFDQGVIDRYIEEIKLLHSYNIKPLVTLHHFTNPMWFEKKGAFTKAENIPLFISFIQKVVAAFGGLVNEYITINEPNVYATNGYFFGQWPPGQKSFFKAVKVMSVMASAHIKSYEAIHTLRKNMGFTDTKVSFANHVRVFDPKNPKNPLHCLAAGLTERFFQGSLTKAMCLGEFSFPITNVDGHRPSTYCDFIAINYYTRSTVSKLGDGVKAGVPVNDLGWEIYPQGMIQCAQALYDLCPLPIYITENGTCDNTDTFRSRYLFDHLQALCQSSLPIERYYHWCFCDNFEWIEGETPRFGLVAIDYESQRRTVKKSGEFFSALIQKGGVTQELYDEYVKDETYHY